MKETEMKSFASLFLTFFLALFITAQNAAGLSGTVTDEAGLPIKGIRVSDGFIVVLTDEDGAYALPPHERQATISVVTPADRQTAAFWLPVEAGRDGGYDFQLEARPKRESFSFLQMSDLETSGWSYKPFYEQNRNLMQAQGDAAFVVFSGDIWRLGEGMRITSQEFTRETFGGLPAYISLGNHDFVKGHERGEEVYESFFGPTRYAFVEGNVLFIVLPMMYGDAEPSFSLEEIADYTRSLLDSWPKGSPVFFITHYYHPYFNRTAFFAPGTDCAFDLSPWKVCGMAYGHTHYYLCLPDLPVPFYNVGQSRSGGGGNMPGATRLFHVDPEGNITTELVESLVTESHGGPVFHALCDGEGRLTVTAFDSEGVCEAVVAEADGRTRPLERVNAWLWTTSFGARPAAAIRVTARFRHGLETRELDAECTPGTASSLLQLEKAIRLPGGKVLFGTPVVAGKRVYVGMADEDNSRLGGVCAVDAGTGEIIWKFTTGLSVRNSVALENGIIYCVDADNTLYKLNADDGALVWMNRCPSEDPSITCHHSITLGEGKVFTGCSTILRAVDQQTGETAWIFRKPIGEMGTTQTPLYHNGRVFLDANWGQGLFALNATDGSLLWDTTGREPKAGFHFQPALTILPDGNVLRAERDLGLTVFNAETGEILKQMQKPELLYSSSAPLVHNGTAYCAAGSVGILAVDLANLERKWDAADIVRVALVGTCQYQSQMHTAEAAPIIMEDKLLAAACDGFLYVLAPSDGTLLDAFEIGSPLLGSPRYADGKLYVTDYAGRLLIIHLLKPRQN